MSAPSQSSSNSLLTPAAAARRLGIEPDTLKHWDRQGRLPFEVQRTPGGQRRYPAHEIERCAEHYARYGELPATPPAATSGASSGQAPVALPVAAMEFDRRTSAAAWNAAARDSATPDDDRQALEVVRWLVATLLNRGGDLTKLTELSRDATLVGRLQLLDDHQRSYLRAALTPPRVSAHLVRAPVPDEEIEEFYRVMQEVIDEQQRRRRSLVHRTLRVIGLEVAPPVAPTAPQAKPEQIVVMVDDAAAATLLTGVDCPRCVFDVDIQRPAHYVVRSLQPVQQPSLQLG